MCDVHSASLCCEHLFTDNEIRWKNQSGADAVRVGYVVAAVVAIGVNAIHVAGAVDARGAEPPAGGRAVQVRNTLVVGGRAGPRLKVGQLRAILREKPVVSGRPADFVTGQQENLTGQAVRATLVSATRTAVLTVRDFDLLDSILDVAVKQVQERAGQAGVDVAAFQLIHIRAVPLTLFVAVLHQQPSAVAGFVIDAARFALMDNDKLCCRTVDF